MGRKFVRISEKELRSKVEAISKEKDANYETDPGLDPSVLKDALYADFKVSFDFENFSFEKEEHDDKNALMGLNTLSNGLTFWGMCGAGDWESSVFFIVYFDGKKLRAYIPTDGNLYNTKTMQAYGNDEEADAENMTKRFYPDNTKKALYADDVPDLDWAKIEEDIRDRIEEKK